MGRLRFACMLVLALCCVLAKAQRTQLPPHGLKDAPGPDYILRSNASGEFEQVQSSTDPIATDVTLSGTGQASSRLKVDTTLLATQHYVETQLEVELEVTATGSTSNVTIPDVDTSKRIYVDYGGLSYRAKIGPIGTSWFSYQGTTLLIQPSLDPGETIVVRYTRL